MLLLVPKCPLCIAAYLVFFTGANAAFAVAVHVRSLLVAMFGLFALLALVPIARGRYRSTHFN
jgi:hypothetical protein